MITFIFLTFLFFGSKGSPFDKNGNLINWWSDEILKRFNEKSNCFVNQYSSIYDADAKMNVFMRELY